MSPAKAKRALRSRAKGRSVRKSKTPKPPPRKKQQSVAPKARTFPKLALASEPGRARILVVGVGASAGGLEAFTELLKHVPNDTGMAFVLVQHLDPVHESALAQILTRATSMPVTEVEGDSKVEPNHVYIMPPNTRMSIERGVLKLTARDTDRTAQRSIDYFFESLAQDQGDRAIGVVLSGTASDGTLGLETIKAEGGITFAQDETAKYDSMPRSAIAAGCVDLVLAPRAIAHELARMSRHPLVVHGPSFDKRALEAEVEREQDQHTGPNGPLASGGKSPPIEAQRARTEASRPAPRTAEENAYKKVLVSLRSHCGVDFTLYKSNTIRRRIARRVVLNGHESLDQYAVFLKGNPKELDALYSDVLISVTSFFRNPEAFESLKRLVFPKILKHHSREGPLRVWTLGCSTGQEAYSIAIAFAEFSDTLTSAPRLQIFATDLNDSLLERARQGLYSKSLADDVSQERLRRFFVAEDGGYRVHKMLREQVVFARQNVATDPPFSRMDLISCRNLLIYLETGLQNSIIPAFHYALRPGGFLFLGASESIGPFAELFAPVEAKQKIFVKNATPTPAFRLRLPEYRGTQLPEYRLPGGVIGPRPEARGGPSEATQREFDAQREADRTLVSLFAPPGVVLNADFQILQFRGATGPYLEPPSGKATFDVLKMAREGLMLPLRSLLNAARRQNKPVRKDGVRVRQNGSTRVVDLQVVPLRNPRGRHYLVVFEPAKSAAAGVRESRPSRVRPLTKRQESSRIAELERELAETRSFLQSIQEDHEAASEELQATGEEMQSANEELQSINEELETSKEELESTNEELTTVNEEMANRNTELSRLNADLNNLQVNMNMAVLLFGGDMRLRRFTALAEKIFNLQASDVGRSIEGIRHDFPGLDDLVEDVNSSLRVREADVQDHEGNWYALRARPYLGIDNKMDGIVVMITDITERKRAEEAQGRLSTIVDSSDDSILSTDLEGKVLTWNRGAERLFGYSGEEMIGNPIRRVIPVDRQGEESEIMERVRRGESSAQFETARRRKDGSLVEVSLTVSPVKNSRGEVIGLSRVDRDMTVTRALAREREELLKREQAARDEALAANEAKDLFLATLSHEIRTPLNSILGWASILKSGRASAEDIKVGMEVIDRNCRMQVRLIDDVLDVSSILSGKLRLELSTADVPTLIQGASDTVRGEAESKNVVLTVELDPAAAVIVCDAERIQQAVWNLLANAVKFTPSGGKVALTSQRAGDHVRITVTDTGKGIDPGFLPKIFERFRQADSKTHTLGLGLSIVKHVVELHDGKVEAMSAGDGKGATFSIRLPVHGPGAHQPGKPDSEIPASARVRAGRPRLDGVFAVVVDDEPDARHLLRRVLANAGAEVVTCASGADALEQLEHIPEPARGILISDITMPEMDGLELIRAVRSRGRHTLPAIALTAASLPGAADRALAAGFQLHIWKPVDPEELVRVIADLVQRKDLKV